MKRSKFRSFARTISLLVALVAQTGGTGAARADSEVRTVQEYIALGTQCFQKGQYDLAIEALGTAYKLRPAPLLLFNIAQAHRLAQHRRQALDTYEQFLKDDPKTPMRGEVQAYVTLLKGQLEMEERTELERQRAAEPPPAPLQPEPQQPAAPVIALAKPAPKRGARRHEIVRVLKWSALGAGLLGVAAGAALWGLDGHRFCPTAPQCRQEFDGLPAGIALVAAGGVALGGAGVLFGLDYRGRF